MKLTLLLVGVGLCALVVSAQEPAAGDYDYYDELVGGAPAEADLKEAEALPPPVEQPLTEAPTEKPTTPSTPRPKKRLVSLRAPIRRPSGVRRRPSPVTPDASEVTTAAPSSPAPTRGSRGRGSSSLSRRRPSRVSTTTKVDEAASTTPEEQPAPSRPSGRGTRFNRPSRKPVTTGSATPSRRFSRPSSATATTQAPISTTHRFSGRRSHLSKSTPTEAPQQETTTSSRRTSLRSQSRRKFTLRNKNPRGSRISRPRPTITTTTPPPPTTTTTTTSTTTTTTPPPTTTTTTTTTTTSLPPTVAPTTPGPQTTRARPLPQPVWIRTPEPPTTTPMTETSSTTLATTTRTPRRGVSRYAPPKAPSHPIIVKVEENVSNSDIFTPPISSAIQSGNRVSTHTDTPTNTRARTQVGTKIDTSAGTRMTKPAGTRISLPADRDTRPVEVTQRPVTRAPEGPTTTSKYPKPSYGPANIRYQGGEVVITEIGTVEDTPADEVRRILGGLGSQRRGLGRPVEKPINKKAEPARHKKPIIEPDTYDYYDDYYVYDY